MSQMALQQSQTYLFTVSCFIAGVNLQSDKVLIENVLFKYYNLCMFRFCLKLRQNIWLTKG